MRAARGRSAGSVPAATRRRCRVPRRRGCRSRRRRRPPPSRDFTNDSARTAPSRAWLDSRAPARGSSRGAPGRRPLGIRRCRRCRARASSGMPPSVPRRVEDELRGIEQVACLPTAAMPAGEPCAAARRRSRPRSGRGPGAGGPRLAGSAPSGSGCSSASRSSATNQNSSRYTSRSSARLKSSSFRSPLRGSRRPRRCGLAGWEMNPVPRMEMACSTPLRSWSSARSPCSAANARHCSR